MRDRSDRKRPKWLLKAIEPRNEDEAAPVRARKIHREATQEELDLARKETRF
jgi:hypothetical protein